MSTELMIPEGDAIPSYIATTDLPTNLNDDAMSGIAGGYSSRVKLSGKQFVLVDGTGAEIPVKARDMVEDPSDGNLYLPAVMLKGRPGLIKAWYATAFNPNEEGKAPDCFSNDGVTPDPSSPAKQCDTCAACSQNAFGSGKDAQGNATGGKACADSKIMAVYIPKPVAGIYKFKIPPASLGNWKQYCKELASRNLGNSKKGIPLPTVKTLIGFDQSKTYSILTFMFGGFVDASVMPKIIDKVNDPATDEIISERITATALPAPAAKPAPKTAEPKKAAPKVEDDLGLGLEEPEKPEVKAEVKADPEPEKLGPSDEELAAELGL